MGLSQVEKADRLLEAALEQRGLRDPRVVCRQNLRDLKQSQPRAYDEAVARYRDSLVPAVAAGEVDPMDAWIEYARFVAGLVAAGTTVVIDPSGRRQPCRQPSSTTDLVLHLPDALADRAIPVALPTTLSRAQQASFDLLVSRRQKLSDS